MNLLKIKKFKGFALITVLLVMVIISILIFSMFVYNSAEYSFSGQARNVSSCYFLAQSAIEYIRAYAETWGLTPQNAEFKKTLSYAVGTAVINIKSFENGKYIGTIEGRQGLFKTVLDISLQFVTENGAAYPVVDWKYASVR